MVDGLTDCTRIGSTGLELQLTPGIDLSLVKYPLARAFQGISIAPPPGPPSVCEYGEFGRFLNLCDSIRLMYTNGWSYNTHGSTNVGICTNVGTTRTLYQVGSKNRHFTGAQQKNGAELV